MSDMSPQPQALQVQLGSDYDSSENELITNGMSHEITSDDAQWTMTAEDALGNKFTWGMDAENNFYVEKNGERLISEEADDDRINIYYQNGGVEFYKDGSKLQLEGGDLQFSEPAYITSYSEDGLNAEDGSVSNRGTGTMVYDHDLDSDDFNDLSIYEYGHDPQDGSDKTDDGSSNFDNPSIGGLPPGEPIEGLAEYFEVEGKDPYKEGDVMSFDALDSAHVTENGNGFRHEVKIKKELRTDMTNSNESFGAELTPTLSPGSKTIVAQYHADDTGTLMKVYVSDTNEFGEGDAADGTFEVYARLAKPDGSGEEVVQLGTIQSGDTFDLQVENDKGYVSVGSNTLGGSVAMEVEDSSASYFKFGNYLQAQDPYTLDKYDSDEFDSFYSDFGITESRIDFANISYSRS